MMTFTITINFIQRLFPAFFNQLVIYFFVVHLKNKATPLTTSVWSFKGYLDMW